MPQKPSIGPLSIQWATLDMLCFIWCFFSLVLNCLLVYWNPRSLLSWIRYNSDRGAQYTSAAYRAELKHCGIVQSMNSDGGRCHDNARCEAMWARMKEELLYGRYDTKQMTIEELKTIIWRYFISYWNHRRICTANGGFPPLVMRQNYYTLLEQAA